VVTAFYIFGGLILGGLIIRIVQAVLATRRMKAKEVKAPPRKAPRRRNPTAESPPLPEPPMIPGLPSPLERGIYYVVDLDNSYRHPVGTMLLLTGREVAVIGGGTSPRTPDADEEFWRNVHQGHLRYTGDLQGQFAEFSRSWDRASVEMTRGLRESLREFDQSLTQLGRVANSSARVEHTSRGLDELVVCDDCYYDATRPLIIFGRAYAAGAVILKEDLARLSPNELGYTLRYGGVVRKNGKPPSGGPRRSRYERLAGDDDLV